MVSVLMPNYNNGPYLKEALDSVFNQTFKDFIIYFVDDGSTDNSLKIAESYDDPRLQIIRKKENTGIVDTMNIALDKITSKYFIRMDGDDISAPSRFQVLVDFMEKHQEIGVCSSTIKIFGQYEEILDYEKDPRMNKAHLIFCHPIGHASSIFRTSVLKDNGVRYKNDFWRMEDYQLFYDLKNYTEITSISDILYFYRKESHNVNSEIDLKKNQEFIKFYKMVFDDLNMNYTEEDAIIHLELSLRIPPTHNYSKYRKHISTIIKCNNIFKNYPEKELKRTLFAFSSTLIYRLIDLNLISLKEMSVIGFMHPRVIYYFFIRKILKRK